MKRLVLFITMFLWVLGVQAEGERTLVFKVDIKDEIGPEVWRLVKNLLRRLRKRMQLTS